MLTVAAASGLWAASETGKAGPLGLLIILLLLAAVFLLGRSMTTHLRRVPASFDEPADTAGAPDTTGAHAPGTGATGTDQDHTA